MPSAGPISREMWTCGRLAGKQGPISELVCAWAAVAEKYLVGEINRDDYDKWRYYYPQYDDTQITARVPSQELSDAMINALKGTIKD